MKCFPVLGAIIFCSLPSARALQISPPPGPAAQRPGLFDLALGIVLPEELPVLTEKVRFEQYVLNTVGPVSLLGEGMGAAIGQWTNNPKEWGQGWGAYGKRLGSNLAYNGIRQSVTYGVSAILHEDNRYFVSTEKEFWPRTKYAIASTVIARTPGGGRRFSFSSVSGVASASILNSTWGPQSWKGPGNIAKNAGISLATNAAFNIVREFLPGMLHRGKAKP